MNEQLRKLMAPPLSHSRYQLPISKRMALVAELVGCNLEDVMSMRSHWVAGDYCHAIVLKVSWRLHIPRTINDLCRKIFPVVTLCKIWENETNSRMSRAMRWHIMQYLLPHPTTMVEKSAHSRLPLDPRVLAILNS